MSKSVLYVAVLAATGAQRFFRCGYEFTPEWSKVEVDEATAKRLREEQMLRVVDEQPSDYQEPEKDASERAVTIGQLAKELQRTSDDGAADEAGNEAGGAGDHGAPDKFIPSAPPPLSKPAQAASKRAAK